MKTYNELDDKDKKLLQKKVSEFIESVSEETKFCHEAVANSFFYAIQRHPQCGRNANKTQKKNSFLFWQKKCSNCGETLNFDHVIFHHIERGIPNQHDPKNLKPYCESCHDQEHHIRKGSLMKGSPKKESFKT
jgi:hypothetical protein